MKTVTRTIKTATSGAGRSSVILDRAASGKVEPDHKGGSRIDEWSLGPFGICDYDGPETVRLRKYVTGTHLLLEEIEVETGATSREVVWTKNKAKLFRYLRPDECPGTGVGRRRSVPVLISLLRAVARALGSGGAAHAAPPSCQVRSIPLILRLRP
jgi:hypothetical protein